MTDNANIERGDSVVPELTVDEMANLAKKRKEEKSDTLKCPPVPEFPLADRVKELGLDGIFLNYIFMGKVNFTEVSFVSMAI
uniref:ThiC-associated domain-containing protein n=1 Tax=Angiostrongylus cantonensis TaxID=6313 RepID=A0A0K0DJQ8_ANGCA